jgi:tellurite resistance protein TerC
MRGAMIAAGWLLLEQFHWIIYVFGAFLIVTGIRMAVHDEVDVEPEANPFLRLIRRFLPITPGYEGQQFFVRAPAGGRARLVATPLLVVLVMVETTDLVFAVDSIPAIFAITTDPFLIFTSNIFAILGLRSMYFLLAGVIDRFHFLKLGIAVVLTFIGTKMLAGYFGVHVPVAISLGVVGFCLAVSMMLSLAFPRQAKARSPIESDPPVPGPPA